MDHRHIDFVHICTMYYTATEMSFWKKKPSLAVILTTSIGAINRNFVPMTTFSFQRIMLSPRLCITLWSFILERALWILKGMLWDIEGLVQCQKYENIFTDPTYKLLLSFPVISDVYRSFIPNKTTFIKYCLTRWISKLPGSLKSNECARTW